MNNSLFNRYPFLLWIEFMESPNLEGQRLSRLQKGCSCSLPQHKSVIYTQSGCPVVLCSVFLSLSKLLFSWKLCSVIQCLYHNLSCLWSMTHKIIVFKLWILNNRFSEYWAKPITSSVLNHWDGFNYTLHCECKNKLNVFLLLALFFFSYIFLVLSPVFLIMTLIMHFKMVI